MERKLFSDDCVGWSQHEAPGGRTYYYHAVTHESVWDMPDEFKEDGRAAEKTASAAPGTSRGGLGDVAGVVINANATEIGSSIASYLHRQGATKLKWPGVLWHLIIWCALTTLGSRGYPVAGMGATLVYAFLLHVAMAHCLVTRSGAVAKEDARASIIANQPANTEPFADAYAGGRFVQAQRALQQQALRQQRAAVSGELDDAADEGVAADEGTVDQLTRINADYTRAVKLTNELKDDFTNWSTYEKNDDLFLEWGLQFTDWGTLRFCMVVEPLDMDITRVLAGIVEYDLQGVFPLMPEILKDPEAAVSRDEEDLPAGHVPGFQPNLVYAAEVGKDPLDMVWRSIDHNPKSQSKIDCILSPLLVDALDEPAGAIASLASVGLRRSGRNSAEDTEVPRVLAAHQRPDETQPIIQMLTPLGEGGRFRFVKVQETQKLPERGQQFVSWVPGFLIRSVARGRTERDVKRFFDFIKNSDLLTERLETGPRAQWYAGVRRRLEARGQWGSAPINH